MADIIIRIAAANGFEAAANADGSVSIFIPYTLNGVLAGEDEETVRTVREAYDLLGY